LARSLIRVASYLAEALKATDRRLGVIPPIRVTATPVDKVRGIGVLRVAVAAWRGGVEVLCVALCQGLDMLDKAGRVQRVLKYK
jgi:hypothetical protein